MSKALENLQRAMDTYRERNKKYGNNYVRFGDIMRSLYPDGLTLKTKEEWNRAGILFMIVSKLARYVTNPRIGHLDSIHDIGVYAFMLEELDSEREGRANYGGEPPSIETGRQGEGLAPLPDLSPAEITERMDVALCQHVWDGESGRCKVCGTVYHGVFPLAQMAKATCEHSWDLEKRACKLCGREMGFAQWRDAVAARKSAKTTPSAEEGERD